MNKSNKQNLEIMAEFFDAISSRKYRDRFVHCASCGEETINGNLRVCSDCLDDESDQFLQEASKS